MSSTPARGGLRVTFSHVTDDGRVLGPFVEQRPTGEDTQAWLIAHAANMTASIAAGELNNNENLAIEGGGSPTFAWCSVAQFRQRLRQRFLDLRGWDLVRLGRYIQSLSLTNAQLQALFGVSAGAQTTALQNKLSALVTSYNATTAQVGQ